MRENIDCLKISLDEDWLNGLSDATKIDLRFPILFCAGIIFVNLLLGRLLIGLIIIKDKIGLSITIYRKSKL